MGLVLVGFGVQFCVWLSPSVGEYLRLIGIKGRGPYVLINDSWKWEGSMSLVHGSWNCGRGM